MEILVFGNKEELCTITAPLHLHSMHLPEPDKYTHTHAHTSQVQVSDGGVVLGEQSTARSNWLLQSQGR